MNQRHLELCASPEWAAYVEHTLLPWVLDGQDLGDNVVELGPGPGRTTDVLLRRLPRLTAVELDAALADALAARIEPERLTVVCADATDCGLPPASFSAVTCFTMLHHLPSAAAQDKLFAQARRLLRPGGLFVGTDGLDSPERRELHVDDVFVPVSAESLPGRLVAAGFVDVRVDVDGDRVRFCASARPAPTVS